MEFTGLSRFFFFFFSLLLNVYLFDQGLSWWQRICQQCRRHRRYRFNPWVVKIPQRNKCIHSSILAWKIPWTEEAGGLQSVHGGRKESDTTEHTHTHRKSPCLCALHLFTLVLLGFLTLYHLFLSLNVKGQLQWSTSKLKFPVNSIFWLLFLYDRYQTALRRGGTSSHRGLLALAMLHILTWVLYIGSALGKCVHLPYVQQYFWDT